MDFMEVGEVLKPQGIKGELKLKPLTDNPMRFRRLRVVYFDGVPYRILSCRVDGFVYLKLEGIDNRNAAETFVGKYAEIDKIHAVSLDEGSYFIADLIGCTIKDEYGVVIGEITDVSNYGAADVFTAVAQDNKIFRFPFLKRVVTEVDVCKKDLIVSRSEFEAVCVYED